jgi:hypothetical protein
VTHEPDTLLGVARWILRHPWDALGRRWNYKSALISSTLRASLFFSTNLSAGLAAAMGALTTEFWFRFATAGFYGALTQAFRRAQPERLATMTALVVLPVVAHSLELLVHWMRGTPELFVSIVASMIFTAVSTTFNLFAMRRGALIVGPDRRTLVDDLAAMPRLVILFVANAARFCARPLS